MFEPGDKVKCIKEDTFATTGKTYVVSQANADYFSVSEDDQGDECAMNYANFELENSETKDTNPKDAVGIRKWRNFTTVSLTVLAEVGVAMLEGARKYGKHNYRVAGVRSSVYVDAAVGHIMQWWEGEDTDPDSGISHITKAIASLFILRDAMIQDMLTDDRPPKANLDKVRAEMQEVVDALFEKYPDAKEAHTNDG